MIDAIDARILKILQENARTSNAEIARQVDLAPSAVFERIRKLEERGVIEGYAARVNPTAVGSAAPRRSSSCATTSGRARSETAQLVAEIPEVLEVHHVAGEDCLLVKVRATDTDALGKLLRDRLGRIETIVTTRTTIVLDTVKESSQLPLPLRRRVRRRRGGARPCLTRGPARQSPRRSRKVVAAFAAVYVLWGSTYLGIRFAIETLPPFFTQGVRFFLAGVLLYAWARWRGEKRADAARVGRRHDHRRAPLRRRHGRPRLGGTLHPFGRRRSRRCNRTHVLRVVGGHAPPPKTARGRSRRPRPGHSGPPRSRRTGNVLRRRALPPRRLSRARGRDLRLGVRIALLARLPASVLAAHGDGGDAS